jgi:carbamoyltransferase
MRILGISAYYHDAAAALISNGEVIAAAQEERFSRKKYDPRFPQNAVSYCLAEEGIRLSDVDYIVFYDEPLLKFERLLETYLQFTPRGLRSFQAAMPIWLREKLFLRNLLRKELEPVGSTFDWKRRLLFIEHHFSHAASAFFPSPFEEAQVLTMDGVGEWATTSTAVGRKNHLEIIKEIHFPHSLGLLYSAMTYYLGFKVNSGEYKVMGLAPYGEPKYVSLILDHLIDLKPDGSFRLNMSYFDYCTGATMINSRFERLFGGPARKPDQLINRRHMDLAASIQVVLEDVVVRLTRPLAAESGLKNLCLAGGVALNCVANGKVIRDGKFQNIWIQPAAGDAGGALGAALAAFYVYQGQERSISTGGDSMNGSYLGPAFDQKEIERRLRLVGARYEVLSDPDLLATCVDALVRQKALGWFQGRMEFGPRALGTRSILADPRGPQMQSQLNLKVKYRESFRPFAPAVLREEVADWFDLNEDSPYMLLVGNVAAQHRHPLTEAQKHLFGIEKLNALRSDIPAVTHVDYSARIQTVHRETNPLFHALISAFKQRTACPVLVNTSFNIRGEPIVCTPEDAFVCFMGTEIEGLAIGNCFLRKEDQDPSLKRDYRHLIEPDV